MAKFRKKPVEIEAWQNVAGADIPPWLTLLVPKAPGEPIRITTLEGTMTANEGDWIIKGVQGELYPCKPDIFLATYDPA